MGDVWDGWMEGREDGILGRRWRECGRTKHGRG